MIQLTNDGSAHCWLCHRFPIYCCGWHDLSW